MVTWRMGAVLPLGQSFARLFPLFHSLPRGSSVCQGLADFSSDGVLPRDAAALSRSAGVPPA
jgi:hypothetical protein